MRRGPTLLAAAAATTLLAAATPAAPLADFTISVAPTSQTVMQTQAAITAVSVTRAAGFTGAVALTATGVPPAATASFQYPSASGEELQVTTTIATPPGTYPVTVTGTAGDASSGATFTVVVSALPPPDPPAPGIVVAGDGRASVAFTGIGKSFDVVASPGGATATGTSSPIVVNGLANGTAYTFSVTPTNEAGTSAPSAPSDPATPTATSADWSPPQVVAPAGTGSVALAADPGDPFGRVYAAWRQSGAIVLSTWQRERWLAPVVVAPVSDAVQPTLAAGADGRVLVAWARAGEIEATFAGTGTVVDVSNTPADSSEPRAGWVPGLGYVLLWLEDAGAAGNWTLHSLVEAHVAAGSWTAPNALYTPPPWTPGSDTGVRTPSVGPLESDASTLVAPVSWFDTRTVRSSSSALVWTAAGWSQPAGDAGGWLCSGVAGALPAASPLIVALDCTGGYGQIATSRNGDVLVAGTALEIGVISGPIATTAAGTTLVAWALPAGIFARSSADGSAWTPAETITPGVGNPVAATRAGNGSAFVAYALPGGEVRTVHRGTPPVADFSVAITPPSQTVTQGDTATASVDVTTIGAFGGAVALTVTSGPPGATTTLSGTTLTAVTTSATPAGTYTIAVAGRSGTLVHTASTTLTVAAPPAPPAPPSGGGGGGGLAADLALTGTVAPESAQSGGTLTWTIRATNRNLGAAVDVFVDLQLSDNLTLVDARASRGPGCTAPGDGRLLHCFLDWMSADAPTADIVVTTTATGSGEYLLNAKVGQLIPDADPANNTLSLRATAPPAPPPSPARPTIRIVTATAAKSGAVTVRVAIVGWTVNTKSVKNAAAMSGYWRIWVDGKRHAVSRQPATSVTRRLAPGRHTIRVELLREDGTALVPPVRSKTIVATVPKRR